MKRVRHELWGFGVIGWAGLLVFIALLAPVIAGVDVRDQFLIIITNTLGIDATYFLVTRIFTFSWLPFSTPQINLISLCLCWPALHLAGGKKHRVWMVVLLLLFAIGPHLPVEAFRLINWANNSTNTLNIAQLYSAIIAGINVLAAIIVFMATRRLWVAAVWLLGAGLNYVQIYVWDFELLDLDGMVYVTALGAMYHASTAGSLYVWAIRSRRRQTAKLPCASCGYELHGLTCARVCPECGEAMTAYD